MKDRLVIDCDYHGDHRIVWFLSDVQDLGAVLGENTYAPSDLKRAKPDDRDHIAATIAASQTAAVQQDSKGYFWPSRRDANVALRECNAAIIAAKADAPWPQWAIKAKTAGWKAPKGWTP